MSSRSIINLALLVALSACSRAPVQTANVAHEQRNDLDGAIGAAELRRDLFVFADDSFHGRRTGTADARRAAAFLAARARQLGLEPAGDSLYLQRVPLMREKLSRTSRIAVISGGHEQVLRVPFDVAPMLGFSGETSPDPSRRADADIIFVGYGPMDDKSESALARFDLEGKVVVALHGAEPNASPAVASTMRSWQGFNERFARLLAFHPAAIVMLFTDDMQNAYEGTAAALLDDMVADHAEPPAKDTTTIPMLLMGRARRGSPLLPSHWPYDNAPQALGRRLTARIEIERQPFTAYNVVAVARGTDLRLNKTYVAFGANYDGHGIAPALRDGPPQPKDSIANGANNSGSGSMALLAIARRISRSRPRRSVLFVWHVGHNQGSLGARYFTSHPPFPLDSVVTELTLEGIAGTESTWLAMVGPRVAPNDSSRSAGAIVDSVNRVSAAPLHVTREWDDPDHPEVYKHSDYRSYAEHRIPSLLFLSWCDVRITSLSDEPQLVDYQRFARVSQLLYESGFAIANRPTRPGSEAPSKLASPTR